MNIDEILTRKSPAVYEISEMEFAIEKYIEKKKNRIVKVNVHKGMGDLNNLNPFGQFALQQEYSRLMEAFSNVQNNYYK